MRYSVRKPDGSQKEFEGRTKLAAAFLNRSVAADWPAKMEGEQEWHTVSEFLDTSAPEPETPESRARRHASISVWMPVALPLLLIGFIPLGFLLEDAKRGPRTAMIVTLLAGYLCSTSIIGLCHGILAARFGLLKGKVGVAVNGIWIVAVVVLAVIAYFSD